MNVIVKTVTDKIKIKEVAVEKVPADNQVMTKFKLTDSGAYNDVDFKINLRKGMVDVADTVRLRSLIPRRGELMQICQAKVKYLLIREMTN